MHCSEPNLYQRGKYYFTGKVLFGTMIQAADGPVSEYLH